MNAKNSSLIIGIAVVVVITAAVTGYSLSKTGRWGTFQGLPEIRDTMKKLPFQIGDWQAEEEREIDKLAINMLRIQDSYIFRTYKNTVTNEIVYLTLMVGPTGKITVHSPEICFGGKDYERDTDRVQVPFNVLLESGDEVADTFWKTNFSGRSLDTNNRVSFYYAVSPGDVWHAVEHPRSTFQSYRYVYKLQAEAFSGIGNEEDTVKRFLTDCLPTIHQYLRPCS